MQIRLTVLGPRSAGSGPDAGARSEDTAGQPVAACDVTVTAPAGTSLAAVTGALVTAAASRGVGPGAGGGAESVPIYAGGERLDPQRQTLGEPPLVDGALVSLGGPAESTAPPSLDGALALLHVVAGPDAGGVHLLRSGTIRIGRSSEADVPLDDPDVSRLHCLVTVSVDGGVAVTDLGSTNGTSVDGRTVAVDRPSPLRPGAALRLGESILRLETDPSSPLPVRPRLPTEPDHEGRLRVTPRGPRGGLTGVRTAGPDGSAPEAGGPVFGAPVPGARPASDGGPAGSDGAARGPGQPPPGAGYDGVPDHRGAEPSGTPAPGADHGRGQGVPAAGGGRPAPSPLDGPPGVAADSPAGAPTARATAAQAPPPTSPSSGSRPPAASTTAAGAWTAAPAPEVQAPAVPRPGGGWEAEWSAPPPSREPAAGRAVPAPARRAGAPSAPPGDQRSGESRDALARHPPPPGAHPGAAVPAARDHAPEGTEGRPFTRHEPGAAAGADAPHRPPGAERGQSPGARTTGSGPAAPRDPVAPPTPAVPHPSSPPRAAAPSAPSAPSGGEPYAADRSGPGAVPGDAFRTGSSAPAEPVEHGRADGPAAPGGTTHGTGTLHAAGTVPEEPSAPRRTRGIGAWARRIAGGRAATPARTAPAVDARTPVPIDPEQEGRWPDPATVLLTALGPGPRLWERAGDHPDALTVRLGTAQRATGPVVPVTVDLRTAGSLGLAGPRPRLTGLTRAVLAQLAALHAPDALELVLIAADERQDGAERRGEWAWAGWLPQARPARGQDCRLLLAFDAEQAAARVGELTRRLDERLRTDARPRVPRAEHGGTGAPAAGRSADGPLPDRPFADEPFGAGPLTTGSFTTGSAPGAPAAGPVTVVLVDGHPGSLVPAETVARLAAQGPAAGIHLLCLAETPPATPTSPVDSTLTAARTASPGFAACGEVALLSGAVATALRVLRRQGAPAAARSAAPATGGTRSAGSAPDADSPDAGAAHPGAPGSGAADPTSADPAVGRSPAAHRSAPAPGSPPSAPGAPESAHPHPDPTRETHRGHRVVSGAGPGDAGSPGWGAGLPVVGGGTTATVDAVSTAWAERFARALAPLRAAESDGRGRPASALPTRSRLLDVLGLARATPAALLARWAADDREGGGRLRLPAGRTAAVLGAGVAGAVTADLAVGRTHLAVTGERGAGKTELLRSLAAALAAGERPDRLGLLLVDGLVGAEGEGLRVCAELPHASTYLAAGDPLRMREFAQALSGELKRRAELLGDRSFEEYARGSRRSAPPAGSAEPGSPPGGAPGPVSDGAPEPEPDLGSSTLNLRGRRAPEARQSAAAPGLPRLVLLVDDFDALVAPALGNPGRPAAGSVLRALEAVARDGARLGVHLVTASGRPEHTSTTTAHRSAALQARLGEESAGAACPGRGVLHGPGGATTAFQAGRVSGRIPRTATVRPTVVPLDWARAGDPPTRRPVRELGNGPTDLALLASAIERAARSAGAAPVAPLS